MKAARSVQGGQVTGKSNVSSSNMICTTDQFVASIRDFLKPANGAIDAIVQVATLARNGGVTGSYE